MKIAVIGSGPSGWAACKKLVQLGYEPTIIDSSLQENDTYINNDKIKKQKLDRKLFFGSDLPYRMFPVGPKLLIEDVKVTPSFAEGGFSLVWGSTMLPYSKIDMKDWPIDISRLNDKYQEIATWIPITGHSDRLSTVYGDYFSRKNVIPSQRVLRILELINQSDNDFILGASRLAVETGKVDSDGCFYCGSCLNGCPGSFIWSTLDEKLNVTRLKLRVVSLREAQNKVWIDGLTIDGHLINNLNFDKVFLASGPVESFRILATSKIVSKDAVLQDSSMFYTPIYMPKKLGNIKENSFALSQIFIRLKFNKSLNQSMYQLYDYSEGLVERTHNLNYFTRIIPKLVYRIVLRRMMISIGYLNSKDSPSIEMKLNDDGTVKIALSKTSRSLNFRNNLIDKSNLELTKKLSQIRMLPIKFLSKKALPGEGFHYGAWLPMGEKSDLLGRPNNCVNIHLVDSSILPSIPPGPITYTLMANAVRIVEDCLR
jgi:hypothetical protein